MREQRGAPKPTGDDRKSQRQGKMGTSEGVRADVTVRLQIFPCCVR